MIFQILAKDHLSCQTSYVSAQSCTRGALERIPNLQKLGIRVQLAPDVVEHYSFLYDTCEYIHRFETLKCVVVNPIVDVAAPHGLPPELSRRLVKLCLSRLRYPWDNLGQASSLPLLRVLKLRRYAFRGPNGKLAYSNLKHFEFWLLRTVKNVKIVYHEESIIPQTRQLKKANIKTNLR